MGATTVSNMLQREQVAMAALIMLLANPNRLEGRVARISLPADLVREMLQLEHKSSDDGGWALRGFH